MTKYRHNKKRNTAFLYESLVIELTKAVLNNDSAKQAQIKKIIQESFPKGSSLLQDLRVYQAVTQTINVEKETAQRILSEAKKQQSSIDSKQLFNEQNRLINNINKFLSKKFFSNFVPNYKELASISQIFNFDAPIKARVLLENEIIEKMSETHDRQEMVPLDSLVYRMFTEKFNQEYTEQLLQEQKELLEKYITSFENNGLELKMYLDEEIGRLKKEIDSCFSQPIILTNNVLKDKLTEVINVLNTFKTKAPDEDMLTKIISIQSLVQEVQSDANQN